MKKKYFFILVLLFSSFCINAQFTDSMEYEDGDPLASWWTCSFDNCDLFIVGPGGGYESDYSGLIPGDGITDVILDLGNQTSGEWGLEFWMFVPSGKSAYFNLLGEVPVGTFELIVGNIFFNEDNASPGLGRIDSTGDTFSFPHDQWFRVAMNFDLTNGMDNAFWGFSVNDIIVVPEWSSEIAGATSLGGVDFFSLTFDNEYYIDNFNFTDSFLELAPSAGVGNISAVSFLIIPNPAEEKVSIISEEKIDAINFYSLQGVLVKEASEMQNMDISSLSSGIYFIEVISEKEKNIQKLVKR